MQDESEFNEDEDECRVCRGPAEEDHPLFKPCICSGSIGFIHQDCLQSWLRVQRGDGSCELCHVQFRFHPKYADDAPEALNAWQVTTGLCRRAVAKWLPLALRSLFAASLWLLAAPLCTAYLYHGWMARPLVILERTRVWNLVVTDLVSGAVVAACIIVSFLSLMSFADFLRVEWQQRGLGMGAGANANNNGNADVDANNNNNNNGGGANDVQAPLMVRHNDLGNPPVGGGAARREPQDADIDNVIWDHVQEQVLQQQAVRAQNNPRLRQLAARERALRNETEEGHDDDSESAEMSAAADILDDMYNIESEDDTGDDDADDDEDDGSWSRNSEEESDSSEGDSRHLGFHDDMDDIDNEFNGEIAPLLRRGHPNPIDRRNRENVADRPPEHNEQIPEQPPAPRPPNDARVDPPFDVDPDDAGDMDINIALDELLGVRGPLLVVGRNLLWLLAFNAAYLGFFAFVPRTVGMAISSILFNTTMFVTKTTDSNSTEELFCFNSTDEVSILTIWKAVGAESIRQNTAFRLHDVATVALGYLSLAFAVVLFRFLWFLSQKVRFLRSAQERVVRMNDVVDGDEPPDLVDWNDWNNLVRLGQDGAPFGDEPRGIALSVALGVALDAMLAIVKVGVLLFLKMFLLPIILGIALDGSTISLFSGSTLEGRIAYAGKDIFAFILLHWVAGITFMLLVTVSVLQLREVAHPDLLAQMIRPQEPQPDLLGNLMHESVGTHSKRMVLSLIIYAFLLAALVYIPVRFSVTYLIGDWLKPHLQLRFAYVLTPQLQVPLELLFFHLCMLALLEKYKNGLGGMQHHWLKFMTKWMGLSDRVLPLNIEAFRLIGSRQVFQRSRKVDPFWYDVANAGKDAPTLLETHIYKFDVAETDCFSTGTTNGRGERVIRAGDDFLRLPVRLPGRALRSTSILLPTKIGKYRLKRNGIESRSKSDFVIELWEEVPAETISRPPEGWDDLGAGGADVQGRWAWGAEKKSAIEGSVAARRPFFCKGQTHIESIRVCLKLLLLGVMSWLAATSLLCVIAATPLAVGRFIYFTFRIPDRWVHDPLAFGVGFLIVFPIIRKVAGNIIASERPLQERIRTWLQRFQVPPTTKLVVLVSSGLLWFGVAPLLLGFVYELAFIKTEVWFQGSESWLDRDTCILSWSVGTILMYIWSDLCILGILSRNYRALVLDGRDAVDDNAAEGDAIPWQGRHGRIALFWSTWKAVLYDWEWDQINEVTLMYNCAAPVVLSLFVLFFFPIATLVLVMYRFPFSSAFIRAFASRFVLGFTCSVQLGHAWKYELKKWYAAAHKSARDDRYLIGEILLNHGEEF